MFKEETTELNDMVDRRINAIKSKLNSTKDPKKAYKSLYNLQSEKERINNGYKINLDTLLNIGKRKAREARESVINKK